VPSVAQGIAEGTEGVITMTATLVPTQATGFGAAAIRPVTDGDLRIAPTKPLLRGRLHQLCALVSLPLGARLVVGAGPEPGNRIAAIAYAVTWTAMFVTSAAYHRLANSPTARRRMRRADHSMIFVHIGGTATSLGLCSLTPAVALVVLGAVWSGVAGGVGVKLTRLVDGGSAGSWLYGVLGGTQALAMPMISASLELGQVLLLAASGVAYGVGPVLFFRKRLDLFPSIFGYHEVWHCFTLVGGLCQYLLVAQLVQS
jgi:hemolysin III